MPKVINYPAPFDVCHYCRQKLSGREISRWALRWYHADCVDAAHAEWTGSG